MGLISLLDRITSLLPIQGRVERWKNEIEKLEQRNAFISINMRNDLTSEYDRNQRKLHKLYKLLKNHAK